jgi:hypothetical protein
MINPSFAPSSPALPIAGKTNSGKMNNGSACIKIKDHVCNLIYVVGFIFILRKPKINIVSEYKPVYQKLCDLSKTCTPKYLPPKKTKAKKEATEMK